MFVNNIRKIAKFYENLQKCASIRFLQMYILWMISPTAFRIGFFLGGIAFSTTVSMFAINMNERYHFDPLHVGFTFVGSALIMIATNAWLTTRIQKAIGLHGAAAFGAAVHCIGLFMFASTLHNEIKDMVHNRRYRAMDLLIHGSVSSIMNHIFNFVMKSTCKHE